MMEKTKMSAADEIIPLPQFSRREEDYLTSTSSLKFEVHKINENLRNRLFTFSDDDDTVLIDDVFIAVFFTLKQRFLYSMFIQSKRRSSFSTRARPHLVFGLLERRFML